MANLQKSSFNSDIQAKVVAAAVIEHKRDQLKQWIAEQNAAQVYIDDADSDPTLVHRQIGKPMSPKELEMKLSKLCPNLVYKFLPDPNKPLETPRMKAIYQLFPDGHEERIMLYHNAPMPEHSIMSRGTEDVPDMTVTKIDRKDLPKSEFNGKEMVFDESAPKPGFKRVTKPARELFRGWRTILLRLVMDGFLTVSQAEGEFGADNRREWAGKTGKLTFAGTPW